MVWWHDLTKQELAHALREGMGREANLRGANLKEADLQGADLRGADLREADLREADLPGADLRGAYLIEANLRGANLKEADLQGANLKEADLQEADLREADLRGAYLIEADLRGADLRGANLRGAYLRGANLQKTRLPFYQICPVKGGFIAYKQVIDRFGSTVILEIYIPSSAKRTASLVGRKCRASAVKVIRGQGYSPITSGTQKLFYSSGQYVHADHFDPDPRVECTQGIHFFMTPEEAEAF